MPTKTDILAAIAATELGVSTLETRRSVERCSVVSSPTRRSISLHNRCASGRLCVIVSTAGNEATSPASLV
jgi:hypothetical protein